MSRFPFSRGVTCSLLSLVLWMSAGCQDVSVTVVPIESVTVSPEELAVQVGSTGTLHASLHGSNGQVLSGRSVEWVSLNPAVASVDGAGRVLGVAQGSATIEARSEGLSGQATVFVTSGPIIGATPGLVEFTGVQDGPAPGDRTVAISNAGNGTLGGLTANVRYTAGEQGGWLTANLSGSTAPATLVLRASQTGLGPGTYTAFVDVVSGQAANSPHTVTVRLTVGAQTPAIGLGTASVTFTAAVTGPNPAQQTVAVSNAGGGTLSGLAAAIEYTSGQGGWLSATLAGTAAPTTLTLGAARGSLLPGTYTARVLVTAPGAQNSPQQVTVTFTVTAAPTSPSIGLSANSASFTAPEGGASPAQQTISVTNAGGGTLSGLSLNVQYTSNQSGWLSASLNQTTAPATLTVRPTTGSLQAGTYTASVRITSSVASNSPQQVDVTFVVTPVPPGAPSGLTASAASLTRIDLSWSSASGSVQGYRIERRITVAGGYALVDSVGAGTTSYSDRDLLPLTGYTYRVQACGPGGCGAWSNEASAITLADTSPPSTPEDLAATRLSSTEVQLTWTAPGAQTRYEIRRRVGTGGQWTFDTTVDGQATSWINAGLQPQTTYQYQIRACNDNGCSQYSSQVTVSTSPQGNDGGG